MRKIRADKRAFHFVYKTTCNVTKKYYVGVHSTDDLHDGYLGSGKHFKRSLRKYGVSNHVREILEMVESRARCVEREREIVTPEMLSDPLCMNLMRGGAYDVETMRKISEAKSGRKRPDMIQKMSDNRKGKPPWNKGKKGVQVCSEETRQKMSQTRRGRKHSEEWKKNISDALMGRPLSKEHREALSRGQTGLVRGPQSEEHRRKISESNKRARMKEAL